MAENMAMELSFDSRVHSSYYFCHLNFVVVAIHYLSSIDTNYHFEEMDDD